jgi:hypothetical protein
METAGTRRDAGNTSLASYLQALRWKTECRQDIQRSGRLGFESLLLRYLPDAGVVSRSSDHAAGAAASPVGALTNNAAS